MDIGTNSVKLLVMRGIGSGAETLADRVEIVRLGEGAAASGVLSDEAMERAAGAIADMAEEARSLGGASIEIAAVATEAVRKSRNSAEFVGLIAKSCGIDVKIISGDEEADLSFRAVSSAILEAVASSEICVFDVGGGSSEIVTGSLAGRSFRRSVPVGALALHNEYFADAGDLVPGRLLGAAREKVRRELGDGELASALAGVSVFIGVGGTITTLASVYLANLACPARAGGVPGTILAASEADRQIELYVSMGVMERAGIAGLDPKRADIILAGACIVRELMAFTGADSMTVLDRGIRYGLMEKLFGLK
ncbi:MAG: Ppx/GppA family phosphatase [Synergistaceae bacterium]|jgi:exopolyphosphatase/guanosine-5'-triphosphate,3'-diphosphate pyrophosphatase|nr:Ppx/GppA family phosphatase [Synergistaceae bacterium]